MTFGQIFISKDLIDIKKFRVKKINFTKFLLKNFNGFKSFFKFKSFALECLAFLVTWVVLGYLWSLIVGKPAD